MIIKRVRIQNFQSHRKSDLDLHPGINVLVGPSDNGKSAIMRAIRWAMRNRVGSGYHNTAGLGAGEDCIVGLALDVNGQEIRVLRRRHGDSNSYSLINGDRREFTGFGRDVPPEIRKLLGDVVTFGKDLSYDIAIQRQGEPHFLVGENPRNMTRVLGRMTAVDVLDLAGQLAGREGKSLAAQVKTLTDEMGVLRAELEAIPETSLVREAADEASKLHRRATDGTTRQRAVSDVVERATLQKAAISDGSATLGLATLELRNLDEIHQRAADSASLLQRLTNNTETVDRLATEIKRLEQISDVDLDMDVDEREAAESRLRSLATMEANAVTRVKLIEEQGLKLLMAEVPGDVEPRAYDSGRLDSLMQAIESATRSQATIEKLEAANSETAMSLYDEDRKLEELLAGTDVCPLSGGELYPQCKLMISTGKDQ